MDSNKVIIVFRTRLRPGVEDEVMALGERMYALASAMPGFLSYKDFASADGESVTVVEFASAEELAAWRNQPEHREAQKAGRERFFLGYHIQVCRIEREYSFEAPEG
jgi:heme-degrading monooxygenase HmoA